MSDRFWDVLKAAGDQAAIAYLALVELGGRGKFRDVATRCAWTLGEAERAAKQLHRHKVLAPGRFDPNRLELAAELMPNEPETARAPAVTVEAPAAPKKKAAAKKKTAAKTDSADGAE